ncbi:MAG: disulfide bond formation protein B [Alphaproteobacteria bacterium]|nr:disulfide bond formation protein B [Alphaproteobacteria bacterium]
MTADPARLVSLSLLLVGLGALAAALVAQHVFGLAPCILCLYQRVPYGLAALLGAVALVPMLPPRWRIGLVALAGIGFLANAGIAVFHVGVEQQWWAGTASCSGGDAAFMDGVGVGAADMLGLLDGTQSLAPALPRCDSPAWSLFGVTMAGYNVVASLVFGLSTLAAAKRLAANGRD